MGAAGSNWPRFFSPFSPFFSTSGGVGSDAPGPTRPRFFLVFFSTAGVASAAWSAPGPTRPRFFPFFFHGRRGGIRMERTRPDSPSSFPCFFSTPGGVASAAGVASAWAAPGPTRPRLFPCFFHARRSGIRHRGGFRMGRTRPDSPSCFFPLFSTSGGVGWSRQLRVEGASQACFFFHAFASSRHLKAAVEGEEGEGLQHLEGETRCCR